MIEMELQAGMQLVRVASPTDKSSLQPDRFGVDTVELTFNKAAVTSLNRGIFLDAKPTGPAPAPVPVPSGWTEQLKLVQSFGDLRSERTNEILAQVVPQTAGWAAIAGLNPEQHRYTLELLGVGLRFAMLWVMQFKWAFSVPRPVEMNATIQPMILTPGYSAFPSGHATEAHFAAELLPALRAGTLLPLPTRDELRKDTQDLRAQLYRFAFRVAENRVVAGLHYPVDSVAGQVLGIMLARLFVARAIGKQQVESGEGLKTDLPADCQPELDNPLKYSKQTPELPKPAPTRPAPFQPADAHLLALLWKKARAEW